MNILYIIIFFLVIIILLLSLSIFYFIKKNIYFSNKEKEFIIFVIDIFKNYGDDLGIQTKEQHEKLVNELEKIKNKINDKT
jgi:hypothetical protein